MKTKKSILRKLIAMVLITIVNIQASDVDTVISKIEDRVGVFNNLGTTISYNPSNKRVQTDIEQSYEVVIQVKKEGEEREKTFIETVAAINTPLSRVEREIGEKCDTTGATISLSREKESFSYLGALKCSEEGLLLNDMKFGERLIIGSSSVALMESDILVKDLIYQNYTHTESKKIILSNTNRLENLVLRGIEMNGIPFDFNNKEIGLVNLRGWSKESIDATENLEKISVLSLDNKGQVDNGGYYDKVCNLAQTSPSLETVWLVDEEETKISYSVSDFVKSGFCVENNDFSRAIKSGICTVSSMDVGSVSVLNEGKSIIFHKKTPTSPTPSIITLTCKLDGTKNNLDSILGKVEVMGIEGRVIDPLSTRVRIITPDTTTGYTLEKEDFDFIQALKAFESLEISQISSRNESVTVRLPKINTKIIKVQNNTLLDDFDPIGIEKIEVYPTIAANQENHLTVAGYKKAIDTRTKLYFTNHTYSIFGHYETERSEQNFIRALKLYTEPLDSVYQVELSKTRIIYTQNYAHGTNMYGQQKGSLQNLKQFPNNYLWGKKYSKHISTDAVIGTHYPIFENNNLVIGDMVISSSPDGLAFVDNHTYLRSLYYFKRGGGEITQINLEKTEFFANNPLSGYDEVIKIDAKGVSSVTSILNFSKNYLTTEISNPSPTQSYRGLNSVYDGGNLYKRVVFKTELGEIEERNKVSAISEMCKNELYEGVEKSNFCSEKDREYQIKRELVSDILYSSINNNSIEYGSRDYENTKVGVKSSRYGYDFIFSRLKQARVSYYNTKYLPNYTEQEAKRFLYSLSIEVLNEYYGVTRSSVSGSVSVYFQNPYFVVEDRVLVPTEMYPNRENRDFEIRDLLLHDTMALKALHLYLGEGEAISPVIDITNIEKVSNMVINIESKIEELQIINKGEKQSKPISLMFRGTTQGSLKSLVFDGGISGMEKISYISIANIEGIQRMSGFGNNSGISELTSFSLVNQPLLRDIGSLGQFSKHEKLSNLYLKNTGVEGDIKVGLYNQLKVEQNPNITNILNGVDEYKTSRKTENASTQIVVSILENKSLERVELADISTGYEIQNNNLLKSVKISQHTSTIPLTTTITKVDIINNPILESVELDLLRKGEVIRPITKLQITGTDRLTSITSIGAEDLSTLGRLKLKEVSIPSEYNGGDFNKHPQLKSGFCVLETRISGGERTDICEMSDSNELQAFKENLYNYCGQETEQGIGEKFDEETGVWDGSLYCEASVENLDFLPQIKEITGTLGITKGDKTLALNNVKKVSYLSFRTNVSNELQMPELLEITNGGIRVIDAMGSFGLKLPKLEKIHPLQPIKVGSRYKYGHELDLGGLISGYSIELKNLGKVNLGKLKTVNSSISITDIKTPILLSSLESVATDLKVYNPSEVEIPFLRTVGNNVSLPIRSVTTANMLEEVVGNFDTRSSIDWDKNVNLEILPALKKVGGYLALESVVKKLSFPSLVSIGYLNQPTQTSVSLSFPELITWTGKQNLSLNFNNPEIEYNFPKIEKLGLDEPGGVQLGSYMLSHVKGENINFGKLKEVSYLGIYQIENISFPSLMTAKSIQTSLKKEEDNQVKVSIPYLTEVDYIVGYSLDVPQLTNVIYDIHVGIETLERMKNLGSVGNYLNIKQVGKVNSQKEYLDFLPKLRRVGGVVNLEEVETKTLILTSLESVKGIRLPRDSGTVFEFPELKKYEESTGLSLIRPKSTFSIKFGKLERFGVDSAGPLNILGDNNSLETKIHLDSIVELGGTSNISNINTLSMRGVGIVGDLKISRVKNVYFDKLSKTRVLDLETVEEMWIWNLKETASFKFPYNLLRDTEYSKIPNLERVSGTLTLSNVGVEEVEIQKRQVSQSKIDKILENINQSGTSLVFKTTTLPLTLAKINNNQYFKSISLTNNVIQGGENAMLKKDLIWKLDRLCLPENSWMVNVASSYYCDDYTKEQQEAIAVLEEKCEDAVLNPKTNEIVGDLVCKDLNQGDIDSLNELDGTSGKVTLEFNKSVDIGKINFGNGSLFNGSEGIRVVHDTNSVSGVSEGDYGVAPGTEKYEDLMQILKDKCNIETPETYFDFILGTFSLALDCKMVTEEELEVLKNIKETDGIFKIENESGELESTIWAGNAETGLIIIVPSSEETNRLSKGTQDIYGKFGFKDNYKVVKDRIKEWLRDNPVTPQPGQNAIFEVQKIRQQETAKKIKELSADNTEWRVQQEKDQEQKTKERYEAIRKAKNIR